MRKERPSSPSGVGVFSLTKVGRDGCIPSLTITSVLEEVSAGKGAERLGNEAASAAKND
jgi:hypothetical protein